MDYNEKISALLRAHFIYYVQSAATPSNITKGNSGEYI
jgi:hypothetical protein